MRYGDLDGILDVALLQAELERLSGVIQVCPQLRTGARRHPPIQARRGGGSVAHELPMALTGRCRLAHLVQAVACEDADGLQEPVAPATRKAHHEALVN